MPRWTIHHRETSASTNLDARGAAAWDVFTASFQTAGRGRLDHKWVSSRGMNLMMSAAVPVDDLPPAHVATLPLAAGLCVALALSRWTAEECSIKWPNDVFVSGRKIAGILCERDSSNVIVGIGVNVAQRDFPPEISSRAVSLALLPLRNSLPSVEEVRDGVLESLDRVFDLWRDGGFPAIAGMISTMDMLAGREIEVVQTDDERSPFKGICGGINPDGSLDVGGKAFYAGETRVLRSVVSAPPHAPTPAAVRNSRYCTVFSSYSDPGGSSAGGRSLRFLV